MNDYFEYGIDAGGDDYYRRTSPIVRLMCIGMRVMEKRFRHDWMVS